MKLTLKQARLLAGYTQKEVAELLGIHYTTYLRWERNAEDMSVSTAKQVSRILNREFEDIFFDKESNLIRQDELIAAVGSYQCENQTTSSA